MELLKKALANPLRIPGYLVLRARQFLTIGTIEREGQKYFLYRGETYPAFLHTGNACSFIKETALTFCQGRGIDVGADKWPLDTGAIFNT